MKLNSLINLWDFELNNLEMKFPLPPISSSNLEIEGFSFFYFIQEDMYSTFFELNSNLIIFEKNKVIFEMKKDKVLINKLSKNQDYTDLSVKIFIPFEKHDKADIFKAALSICFDCVFISMPNGEIIHTLIGDSFHKYEIDNSISSIESVFNRIFELKNGPPPNQQIFSFLKEVLENKVKKIFSDWKSS